MKLITINIKRGVCLERVLSFVETESPDVICLQEILETDLVRFETRGYTCTFLPMTIHVVDGVSITQGIAICSKATQIKLDSFLYHPASETLQYHDPARVSETIRNGVLIAHIPHEGNVYVIATTHFTWTPDGDTPNDNQKNDLSVLLERLSHEPAHIICGDFNIPRHLSPLYTNLTKTYIDNIPASYTSSLDKDFHRLKNVPEKNILFKKFMVDYIFSQPPYIVSDVRLQFGLSDHAGIVATIHKQ